MVSPNDPAYDLLLQQINRVLNSVDSLRDSFLQRFTDLDERYPTKNDLLAAIALMSQRHEDHVRQGDVVIDGLEKEMTTLRSAMAEAQGQRVENRRWLVAAVLIPLLAAVAGAVASNGWHF